MEDIDDTGPHSWTLNLENGYKLVFAPSISNEMFEPGDTVLMGFEDWDKFGGFAHFCHYRGMRQVQEYTVGPAACKVVAPDQEVIFDGEKINVIVDSGTIITCISKRDESIKMSVFPTGDTFAAGPAFDTSMSIEVDQGEPVVVFAKRKR